MPHSDSSPTNISSCNLHNHILIVIYFCSQVDGVGASSSDLSALGTYGQQVRQMLLSGSGREELEVFVHFANGDESPASWYSEAKLSGLAALKKVYDPAGLFSWYNPVSVVQ